MVPWFYAEDEAAAARCPRYGREVDCWSLGVSLYVMLSGEAPFEQEQPVEDLLKEVCRGKVAFHSPSWTAEQPARSRAPSMLSRASRDTKNCRAPSGTTVPRSWRLCGSLVPGAWKHFAQGQGKRGYVWVYFICVFVIPLYMLCVYVRGLT